MTARTPESKIKAFVKQFMKKEFPEAFYYSPPGGAFGRAGIPDLFYLYKGVFIAIEVKSDVGKLSDLQKYRLQQIRDAGGIAATVYGKDINKMMRIKQAIYRRLKHD